MIVRCGSCEGQQDVPKSALGRVVECAHCGHPMCLAAPAEPDSSPRKRRRRPPPDEPSLPVDLAAVWATTPDLLLILLGLASMGLELWMHNQGPDVFSWESVWVLVAAVLILLTLLIWAGKVLVNSFAGEEWTSADTGGGLLVVASTTVIMWVHHVETLRSAGQEVGPVPQWIMIATIALQAVAMLIIVGSVLRRK